MRNVLVTGGAGYIGSHVCKELFRSGFTPICLDDLSSGYRSFVKWGPLLKVDLNDGSNTFKAIEKLDFSAVIHMAAKIEVRESLENPVKYYRNNVGGFLNLMQALHMLNKKIPIIFSSTAAIYGSPETTPISEDHYKSPINPYGSSKKLVEDILFDLWNQVQWPSIILRYFNVAGADPEGNIGESHVPETHLIPRLLMSRDDPHFEMKIFGDDHPTADGTCVRDYVHVSDLAKAHILALKHILKSPTLEYFNVGYNKGYSVKQIISAVEQVSGAPLTYSIVEKRQGEPAELVADASKIRKQLGWMPEYENQLQAMIEHSWNWLKIGRPRN